MGQADQVGGSLDGGIPQSTSCFCLDSPHPVGGEVDRVRGVEAVSKAGWLSHVSRIHNLLKAKIAGLFAALVVASSLIVVMGLVSTPMASASPYRAHAVGSATKSSLVSPHTPTDSAAPLNSVNAEAYVGDAAPVVTTQTPLQPIFNNGNLKVLDSAWVGGIVTINTLNSGTPIVAGQTYDATDAQIVLGDNSLTCRVNER